MVLCDYEIKELCTKQSMITPFDEELLNPNSLDLRCGYSFKLLSSGGIFCPVNLEEYSETNPYYLEPRDRGLLASLEVFNIPQGICGEFKLKSSRAREFLNHMLAGWIDSQFSNSVLTMELINQSYDKIGIYPGFRIGQIIFHRSGVSDKSYKDVGRYNNCLDATLSKG